MSRVTEYPDDEARALRAESGQDDEGGKDAAERSSRLPRTGFGGRLSQFYHDVKLEMRKTTWPTRNEVWSTTLVVIIAVIFFGFYLWGVDLLVTMGFDYLQNVVPKG